MIPGFGLSLAFSAMESGEGLGQRLETWTGIPETVAMVLTGLLMVVVIALYFALVGRLFYTIQQNNPIKPLQPDQRHGPDAAATLGGRP